MSDTCLSCLEKKIVFFSPVDKQKYNNNNKVSIDQGKVLFQDLEC